MLYLQFAEDLCEESGLAIDSQHFGAKSVDDQETSVPEFIFAILNEERFQRITNLVAHVTIAQIKTRQHRRLEFFLGCLVPVDELFHQHVYEHYIGRVYKGHILQTKRGECAIKKTLHLLLTFIRD